jgi:hypothetical protein
VRKIPAALTMAVVALLVVAGPASAQYPPPPIDLELSDSTVTCTGSEPVTISGSGFTPGQEVTITFDGETVGSATPNSEGEFAAEFSPEAAEGAHTVTATQEGTGLSASGTITCIAEAAEAAPGEVAFTGTNITVGLVLLIGLTVIGVAALVAGRRRARSV